MNPRKFTGVEIWSLGFRSKATKRDLEVRINYLTVERRRFSAAIMWSMEEGIQRGQNLNFLVLDVNSTSFLLISASAIMMNLGRYSSFKIDSMMNLWTLDCGARNTKTISLKEESDYDMYNNKMRIVWMWMKKWEGNQRVYKNEDSRLFLKQIAGRSAYASSDANPCCKAFF